MKINSREKTYVQTISLRQILFQNNINIVIKLLNYFIGLCNWAHPRLRNSVNEKLCVDPSLQSISTNLYIEDDWLVYGFPFWLAYLLTLACFVIKSEFDSIEYENSWN